jgi:hypothetical protein
MTEKKVSKPKKPTTHETKEYPRKNVQLFLNKGDSEEVAARKHAALVISPELAAYRVINGAEQKSGIGEGIDVPALMEQLRDSAAAVNRGDLAQAEAMLMNQATALQSLFARLAERAMTHDQIPGFDANMRMALRAQSQCRATLEALATIKNPPIVYAKQANFAAGHQQVNNCMPAPTQALENENQQSKLLEAHHGEWLDTGTAGAAIGADKAMATVGEIDGAKNNRG